MNYKVKDLFRNLYSCKNQTAYYAVFCIRNPPPCEHYTLCLLYLQVHIKKAQRSVRYLDKYVETL